MVNRPCTLENEINEKWIRYPRHLTTDEPLALRLVTGEETEPAELILDCGAGNGRLSIILAKSETYVRVVSLDLSKEMVYKIKEHRTNEELDDKIEVILADMQHLPFKDAQFDGLLNVHNLWYVTDYSAACSEMLRVCGGIIVIDHINLFNPRNFVHCIGHMLKTILFSILKRPTFPIYYRTPKQILSPFASMPIKLVYTHIGRKPYLKLLSERFLLYIQSNRQTGEKKQ